ncbi:MAG: AAA family ATPase [Nocardioidaceae bacterium]
MGLLERNAPLASLAEYAEEARNGSGRLVLVAGEAGVGKSALLEEFQGELPASEWLWGACDGLFTPRPLAPLLDIAERMGGELWRVCGEGAPRDDLFAALLRQVSAAETLSVLVIEDVHWADEATLDLVRFLGRRIRDANVLVLVTYRDDALAPTEPLRVALGELSSQRTTRRVVLPALTEDAVSVLAEGSQIPAAELHQLTGGNPFFVTEVLRSSGGTIPTSARDAVLSRVAIVSEPARHTLEMAALDGTRVDSPLMAAAGADVRLLDELVSAGLLRGEGGELRFSHELARLAVESTVAPHRQVTGHRAILDALITGGCRDDARLAYHAEEAGASDLVAAFATRAGRHAATLGAHREAAAQFERALRYADDQNPAAVAELLDELADELTVVDRWPESAEARQSALDLWHGIGDRRREGEDLRRLSTVMWRLCRGAEHLAALKGSIDLLEPLGDNPELARGYSAYAFVLWASDPAAGEAMLLRASEMADALDDPSLRSDVLNNRAAAEFNRDQDWTQMMDQALRLALEADAPPQAGRAYANAYTFYIAQFRYAEGERYWHDGIEYCDERDISTFSTCLRGHRAIALLDLGRWDEAAALARLVLATEASPVNLLTSQVTLGLVGARRGESEGVAHLEDAVRAADSLDEADWVALTRRARAEARWLGGDLEGAATDLDRARSMISALESDEDAAVAVWERRLDGEGRTIGPVAEPFASQLAGHHEVAAKRWAELGCGYHAALAWYDAGTDEGLREGLRRFEELGATAPAAMTRRRMRDLGLRSIPSGTRTSTKSHPRGLTVRENEVLALLCEGLTNEEIGARLFISAKTVDHHVSAVLGKLEVPSRRRAADEARRMGLVDAAPATT